MQCMQHTTIHHRASSAGLGCPYIPNLSKRYTIVTLHICTYSHHTTQTGIGSPSGYDRTRNVEIGNKNIKLTHLEEAYTSEHWLVRIYRYGQVYDMKVKCSLDRLQFAHLEFLQETEFKYLQGPRGSYM